MIEGAVFIGAIVIAVTQALKSLSDLISGPVTTLVAVGVGIVIALVDVSIGVVDVSVAEGILIALGAVGTHTVAREIG